MNFEKGPAHPPGRESCLETSSSNLLLLLLLPSDINRVNEEEVEEEVGGGGSRRKRSQEEVEVGGGRIRRWWRRKILGWDLLNPGSIGTGIFRDDPHICYETMADSIKLHVL